MITSNTRRVENICSMNKTFLKYKMTLKFKEIVCGIHSMYRMNYYIDDPLIKDMIDSLMTKIGVLYLKKHSSVVANCYVNKEENYNVFSISIDANTLKAMECFFWEHPNVSCDLRFMNIGRFSQLDVLYGYIFMKDYRVKYKIPV